MNIKKTFLLSSGRRYTVQDRELQSQQSSHNCSIRYNWVVHVLEESVRTVTHLQNIQYIGRNIMLPFSNETRIHHVQQLTWA